MKKDELKLMMIDYLCGELEQPERHTFEQLLEEDPELLREFEELSAARERVNSLPADVPEHPIFLVDSGAAKWGDWWRDVQRLLLPESLPLRMALAAALLLILFMTAAAISDMELRMEDGSFSLRFGAPVPAAQQPDMDEELLATLAEMLREENRLLTTAMIAEAQLQQEETMEDIMLMMIDYIEYQREVDFRGFADGLVRVEQENLYRHLVTYETLNDLFAAFSLQ